MRWTNLLCAAALLTAAAPVGATAAPRHDSPAIRAAWLAQRADLARRLPLAPDYARAVENDVFGYDMAFLLDADDLNGDGGDDFVDLRDHVEFDDTLGTETDTVRLEAHRGGDGALLWTVTPPTGFYTFVVFVPTGANGRPGIVTITYGGRGTDAIVAGGGQEETVVNAYDGAGKALWTKTFEGAGAYHLSGWLDSFAAVDGFFDAVPGGGLDLLVNQVASTDAEDPTATVGASRVRSQLAIVDGATGLSHDVGDQVVADAQAVYGTTLGDLDGDRKDDLAVVTIGDKPTISARRSSNGGQLWSLSGKSGSEWDVWPLTDATGDGVADIAVVDYPNSGTQTVSLVDGKAGKIRWTVAGSRFYPIGDADRHPGSEIVVAQYLYGSSSRGFAASVLTGSGHRIWSLSRSEKTSDLKEYTSNVSIGTVGDTNTDGVKDFGWEVVVTPYGATTRRDAGTADGRTGKVTRDPVKDFYATTVAIDGSGADAYTRTLAGGFLTVSAWRGSHPARLWTSKVAVEGSGITGSFGAYANGDRCGDVVVSVADDDTTSTLVLSGAGGAPLWLLTRSGGGAPTVSHPKPKSLHSYKHTC